MKKHLVSIWFDMDNGKALAFTGFVTTSVISPSKLFEKVFKRKMPPFTKVSFFIPAQLQYETYHNIKH